MCAILVVDDDCDFGRAFLRLCKGEYVIASETIDDGIAMAAELQPDYIFMDVRFNSPWRTGIDAIKEVLEVAPSAKIVIMSAAYNDYDRARALKAGAVAYVYKTDLVRTSGVPAALQATREVGQRDRRASRSSLPAKKKQAQ